MNRSNIFGLHAAELSSHYIVHGYVEREMDSGMRICERLMRFGSVTAGAFLVASCSLADIGGRETHVCSDEIAESTVSRGGLQLGAHIILEGCRDQAEGGLREGETRIAVVRLSLSELSKALGYANIRTSEASRSTSNAKEGPPSFDVLVTPLGEPWRPGERLTLADRVHANGRTWNRYVAWGQERSGSDYLLMVELEKGSL